MTIIKSTVDSVFQDAVVGYHLDGLLVHHVDVKGQVLEAFDQAPPGTLHCDGPEDSSRYDFHH